jgi:8-oxo-dGTP diphosphatase
VPRIPIQAAGGLLWLGSGRRLRVAIVHRTGYDDWALPKGKLKRGESWLEAAVREVREETGFDPKVLGFAGALGYDTNRGPKVVRLWNMTPRSEEAVGVDPNEILSIDWLKPAKAMQQLSYPLESAIVEAWHEQINL